MKNKVIEAVKPYATKPNIALILVVLVILFEVGRMFYGGTPKGYTQQQESVKRAIEAIEKNDKQRAKEMYYIRLQRASDSMSLASIKFLVENVPHILNQISLKYEKDRRNLASMPFDARFLFFANYIAQGDSIANRGHGN